MRFSSPTSRPEDGLFLPEGAGPLIRCKVGYRALTVLAKQKDDSVAAPLFNVCIDGEIFARLGAKLARTDDGQELLRARPNLQSGAVNMATLHALPEGTLGHELARYYVDNGIKPFESPYPISNDVDYLAKRYRETHDIVHVLTGYGTDPVSELELQAFALGNLGLRQCIMIILFAAVTRADGLPPVRKYTDKLWAAYRRGRKCKDILGPHYERYWESTVEDVRQQLHLPPLVRAIA